MSFLVTEQSGMIEGYNIHSSTNFCLEKSLQLYDKEKKHYTPAMSFEIESDESEFSTLIEALKYIEHLGGDILPLPVT